MNKTFINGSAGAAYNSGTSNAAGGACAGAGASATGGACAGAAGGACGSVSARTGSIVGGASSSTLKPNICLFKNFSLGKFCFKAGRILRNIIIGAAIWWLIGHLFPELRTDVLPDFYHLVDMVLSGFNRLCSLISKILPF